MTNANTPTSTSGSWLSTRAQRSGGSQGFMFVLIASIALPALAGVAGMIVGATHGNWSVAKISNIGILYPLGALLVMVSITLLWFLRFRIVLVIAAVVIPAIVVIELTADKFNGLPF